MKEHIKNYLKIINKQIKEIRYRYSKSFDLSDAILLNNYKVQKDLLEELQQFLERSNNAAKNIHTKRESR